MRLFNKDDGFADVVARRLEGGGDHNALKTRRGILSRIKNILNAWQDNRQSKKRKKNIVPIIDTAKKQVREAPTEAPKRRFDDDFPPEKNEPKVKKSKRIAQWFPEGVTFNPQKIRHWTWKQYTGAITTPIMVAVIGYFVTQKTYAIISDVPITSSGEKLDMTKNLAEQGKTSEPEIESTEKEAERIMGNISLLNENIAAFSSNTFPAKTMNEKTPIFYDSRRYWSTDARLNPDQKLKIALISIDNVLNKKDTKVTIKLSREEFSALADTLFNDDLQSEYATALIDEVETYIKTVKGNEKYKKLLQDSIRSIRLSEEYIMLLHKKISDGIEKELTRDIKDYQKKKIITAKVVRLKEEYAIKKAAYQEAYNNGNRFLSRPGPINVTNEEREIYNTYYDRFKNISDEVNKKSSDLINTDMRSENGLLHLALESQNRLIRILNWLYRVGRKMPIEKVEESVIFNLPKDQNESEQKPTDAQVAQSPDSSSGSQSQEKQYPQSPQKVQQ